MIPYEFLTLRYMHNLSSQEFVNIAVLMWLPETKQVKYKITCNYERILRFFRLNDINYKKTHEVINHRLKQLEKKTTKIESIENIRDLIAPNDGSCFQWSTIMGGMSSTPEKTLDYLFDDLIIKYNNKPPSNSVHVDDHKILTNIKTHLQGASLINEMQKEVEIKSPYFKYKFSYGWQNGHKQVIEPISFDLQKEHEITEKAIKWSGRLLNLGKENPTEFQMTGVVASPKDEKLQEAFYHAIKIVESAPYVRKLILQDELKNFIPEIRKDIASYLKRI
jgi:iron-sulfur cluster repair protein YtfE (RIC family)